MFISFYIWQTNTHNAKSTHTMNNYYLSFIHVWISYPYCVFKSLHCIVPFKLLNRLFYSQMSHCLFFLHLDVQSYFHFLSSSFLWEPQVGSDDVVTADSVPLFYFYFFPRPVWGVFEGLFVSLSSSISAPQWQVIRIIRTLSNPSRNQSSHGKGQSGPLLWYPCIRANEQLSPVK